MTLKKITVLLSLLIAVSCGKDNDDIILPNDVSNIDPIVGITFGKARKDCTTTNCNLVFRFSEGKLFQSNNNIIPNDGIWTYFKCPFDDTTEQVTISKDILNIARGVRDIPSTVINDPEVFPIDDFFILEYIVSEERKTLQFSNTSNFTDKRTKAYLDYLIETVNQLESLNGAIPNDCTI